MKVLLVAGTDAHGVTMGALSRRALEAEGHSVEVFCEYPATGQPSRFWGDVFLKRDMAGIDWLVVVDVPLPQPDNFYPNAAEDALARLAELTAKGLRVLLVDHHKTSEAFYGRARQAGCEVILTSSAVSCHYGAPDRFTTKWGRYGATADKDPAVLPVSDYEEKVALGLDSRVRERGVVLEAVMDRVLADDEGYFVMAASLPEPPLKAEVRGSVVVLPEVAQGWGFKQLDAACKAAGCSYGVAADFSRGAAVIAITYWKSQALPVALALRLTSFIGHGEAVVLPLSSDTTPESLESRREAAMAKISEIVAALNELTREV